MIKYVARFSILILLACPDATGPGSRPMIVYMGMGSLPGGYGPDGDVFVMDSLGRHVVNLTHRVERDEDPAWSPDGAKIVFSRRDSSGAGHLFLMNPDGRGLTQLTFGASSEWGPACSPDGAKIAFISSSDLYVMNADGSGVTPLLTDAFIDDHPSWSPDGRIAFFFHAGRKRSECRTHLRDQRGWERTHIGW